LDGQLFFWAVDTRERVGDPLPRLSGGIQGLAFDSLGQRLLAGADNGPLTILDARTGNTIATLNTSGNAVWTLVLSPDGRTLVSAGNDDKVQLWMLGSLLDAEADHSSLVSVVTFSPDGKIVATAGLDGRIIVWPANGEPGRGRVVGTMSDSIISLAFSPDGSRIASASADGQIALWNPVTGALIHEPVQAHWELIWRIVFSPDGTVLASASSDARPIGRSPPDGGGCRRPCL
jgi:WD40 repeat protein